MNLTFSEEQEMLRKAARDFLEDKCPKKLVKQLEESEKGYSPELWQEIAELGWIGLAFPEKYGGSGMSFFDLVPLLEEMGRACFPSPFFSTAILGGLTILNVGSEEQKQQYLSQIASGKQISTLALVESDVSYNANSIKVKAIPDNGSYVITGTKMFVPDAQIADYLLCVVRTNEGVAIDEGITIFLIDTTSSGISYSVLNTIAGDKLCEVVLDQVQVPKGNILGQLDQGWSEVPRILERAAVAKCCEVIGNMQKVLEMTVDYAKERKQFDRPIGSFQIIQHYCADMATYVDGAKLVTYQAAWMISQKLPCAKEVAVAKAWICEVSPQVTNLAHQINGAIGLTMEHDLHFYTGRAKAGELTYGDANFYRDIVAKEMGLA